MRRKFVLGLITLTAFFLLSSPLMAAKRWAILFGVNYKGNTAKIPPLEACEEDARLMAEQLQKHGNYDEVRILLGRQVTAANVKKTLNELAKSAGKEDTVILFFAGHGTSQRDAKAPNGLRNTIIMYDRPHVTDEILNQWVKGIKTEQLVWIFDCCFSGGIVRKGRRGSGEIPIAENQSGKVIVNGKDQFYFINKTLVSSSDANETAQEFIRGKTKHGIFTYWFAQGIDPAKADLNRDQTVTLLEAFEWASRRTTDMAKKFKHNQHPQITGNPSGILLSGRLKPQPPKVASQPTTVKPPSSENTPQPASEQIIATPSLPLDPITFAEPPVIEHIVTSDLQVCTTIFKSRIGGVTTMDAMERLRINRRGDSDRKIRIQLSGRDYPVRLSWVDQKELKRRSGIDLPLGSYSHNQTRFKNLVACFSVQNIPTGIHEVTIEADDYSIIKRRVAVEKESSQNKLFVVASLAGYGTIQGRVFFKNFETPLAGQKIWMPVVKAPNQIHKVTSQEDGSFWFLNLPPSDDYFIKASFLESIPLDNRYINVKSGSVTTVDVVLNKKLR